MILSRKLLARYRELKQDVPDCLLLMQVGAFMQVMGDDARTVSQVTGLTQQMAGAVKDPEDTLISRDALEQHGPFGEMDLQAILSQQLRTNEHLASWYKGRFRSDGSIIEGEIDKVYVFLNALPSGKDRHYATNKLWMQPRTQRIG